MKRFYLSKLIILLVVLSGWTWDAIAQCNCNWLYKVPITIANGGASALTNYQVSITVNTAALVTAGKMLATGNDIRFGDAACVNLPYWIENGTMNTATTKIWINVNSIPVAGTTINMFYGNPSATAASNGDATFLLFDDFNGSSLDLTKWQFLTSGCVNNSVSGGNITITSTCGIDGTVRSINSFAFPYLSEFKVVSISNTYPNIAQSNTGSYSNGVTLTAVGGSMFMGGTCPSSSSYAGWCNWLVTASMGTSAGIWSLVRTSSNTIGTWPGGSMTSASSPFPSANQQTSFGLLDYSGGGAQMVVDFVRLRQYYAAGTTQTLGSEISNLVPPITGTTVICLGSTSTLSDATSGGTWTSSAPGTASVGSTTGVVTGVAAGTANITYTTPSGCFAVATVTINPSPAVITGAGPFCQFTTLPLSTGVGGGTWSSSNIAVATVGSTTGVVTGVTAGTATISYTLPSGCYSTAPVTVNAAPLPIAGAAQVCASGGTTTLSDGVAGGNWTSSAPTVATIGLTTGLVTGVAAGNTVITYTLPTGCQVTLPFTVNPLPAPIGGSTSVCVGSTTTLTDGTPGGTWTSSNTALATVGLGTGVVTGVFAGIPTITYTLASTGCRITTPVLVNALPSAISGASSVCVGQTISLSDGGGGSWTSSTPTVATIGALTGVVTGVAPGTTTITYTLPSGCSTTTNIAVNAPPLAYTVTGGGSYCSGGSGVHVGLSYGSSGVSYQLYNTLIPTGFPVLGSNSGLDFGSQTGAGNYTVVGTNTITGCSSNMTGSVNVSILPLPNVYNVTVTGDGGYCAGGSGVHLGVDNSTTGVKYQLYMGASPVGPLVSGTTGSPVDFGLYTTPGTYSVWATITATGCGTWMSGSPTVFINPLPTVYTVSGGGNYCIGGVGSMIFLSGSDVTANYQVFMGPSPVGGAAGTGTALSFGPFTGIGTYTIVATDATGTGCTSNMLGSVSIGTNPLPTAYTVTGGGGYCAGGVGPHVGLSFSNTGVTYALYRDLVFVSSMIGSGSGLDFGVQMTPGNYTVVATNDVTHCVNNMTGSVNVNINPLPTPYVVSGDGSYCAGGVGLPVNLSGSDVTVNYSLYRGTTLVVGPVPGIGGPGFFGPFTTAGTYTVVAVDILTGCTTNLPGSATIIVNPLPAIHTVTGGGSYCQGGTGVHVVINGTNVGVTYTVYNGPTVEGSAPGTGGPVDFGLMTDAGTYTVVASDDVTGCTRTMSGSANITINPLPTQFNMTGGGSYCAGGTGFHIGLDGSNNLISYQLMNGSSPVGSPLAGSGLALDFGIKTVAGTYTVTATNVLTGCTNSMNGFSSIVVNPLPSSYPVTGGGNYCAGGAGVSIGLGFSDEGVNYQLYRGTTAVGAPTAGIGGALDFGPQTAGVYTVVAIDGTTGCTKNMAGSATSVAVSPNTFTVTGGGGYCAGGTGVHVGLSGSQLGVSYQLVMGTPVGLPMNGTGASLDFGLKTAAGIYTIVATDTTLGCTANMMSSATVAINPLPTPVNVTGGGRFCAGEPGVHVGIDGSATGINYQLYRGITAVGTAVTGTGSAIDFGLETVGGTYTVLATNATTSCSNNMLGSATVTVRPIPFAYIDSVGGYYGNFCATDSGVHVYLTGSDTAVYYQLYRGTTLIGSAVPGTGNRLDMGLQIVAGTYTITARDSGTSCSNVMAGSAVVNIVPLPTVHTITGGGNFCPGGSGVLVGLDGSDAGIVYKLFNGTTLMNTMYGTGVALDFGLQNNPGTYNVVANSAITDCPNGMFGTANVAYDSLPTPIVSIRAYPGTGVDVWHIDSMRVFVANGGDNPTFQWYVNNHLIPGATNASFSRYELFNRDSVSCQVTASGPCGGLTTTKSLIITLRTVGVNQVATVASDVRLVPNPNKGAFNLKGTLGTSIDEDLTIEVTNMLGQVVYTGTTTAHGGNIDEHIQLNGSLANGMYMLNLRSQSQNTVFHFVIEQ